MARHRSQQSPQPVFEAFDDERLNRVRRFRRRGEHRRAMLLLREACYTERDNARLWTLYGVQCFCVGRREDAIVALGQAVWLRERARDGRRAQVVRELIERIELGSVTLRAA